MKGGHGNMHMQYSANGNRRRKWNAYLLTLTVVLLVFGAAVLGLMGIQRLRDRRIFNLQIKQKDNQILSLRLLLQKEREHVQDDKMRGEEMRMKIYSLRAQKKELDGKILQLQSTISSLKEERKILESGFEEQQNEAKLLRERYSQVDDQNPQVKSRTEVLIQKEAEIEDLQHRLQVPVKVSSVSSDDPSNLQANLTAMEQLPESKTVELVEHPRDDGRRARMEKSAEKGGEMSGKVEPEKLESSQQRSFEDDRYQVQNGESSDEGKKTNEGDSVMTRNAGNKEKKPTDEGSEAYFRDDKKIVTDVDSKSIRIPISQESDDSEMTVGKGGLKLEVQNNNNGSNRLRGKHSYLKRTKGKRWRAITREIKGKGTSGSDEAKITKDTRFEKDDKLQGEQVNIRANLRAYTRENTGANMEDSSRKNKLQDSNTHTDPKDMSLNEEKDANMEILTNSSSVKSEVSFNEVQQYTDDNKNSGSSNGRGEQHLEKVGQSNEPDSLIRQHIDNKNNDVHDQTSGQMKAETKENQNDTENGASEETETRTSTSMESVSSEEKTSEDDEEQGEESEF